MSDYEKPHVERAQDDTVPNPPRYIDPSAEDRGGIVQGLREQLDDLKAERDRLKKERGDYKQRWQGSVSQLAKTMGKWNKAIAERNRAMHLLRQAKSEGGMEIIRQRWNNEVDTLQREIFEDE
jgi:uncharacterized protein YukE